MLCDCGIKSAILYHIGQCTFLYESLRLQWLIHLVKFSFYNNSNERLFLNAQHTPAQFQIIVQTEQNILVNILCQKLTSDELYFCVLYLRGHYFLLHTLEFLHVNRTCAQFFFHLVRKRQIQNHTSNYHYFVYSVNN